jgi:hypothetical protein
MRMGGQRHAPADLPPGKRPGTPIYMRLDEPQGQSGWVRENSPQPRFDRRTVQLVVYGYSDCAFPDPWRDGDENNNFWFSNERI